MSAYEKYINLSQLERDIEATKQKLETLTALREKLVKTMGGPDIPINRKGGTLDLVVQYLREHGNKPTTMGEFEEKLGVSRTALKQVFYVSNGEHFNREHQGKTVRFSLKM